MVFVTLLTGCSSFVQQAAPIEAPMQPPPTRTEYRTPAPAVATASSPAQTVPYRPVASLPPIRPQPPVRRQASADNCKTHVVQPGENLFRIALSHGLRYEVLAKWNNLPDYAIKVGQVLRLTPPPAADHTESVDEAPSTPPPSAETTPAPVKAVVVKTYPKALKLAYSDTALHTIAVQSEGTSSPATPPAANLPARTDSSAAASRTESRSAAPRTESASAPAGSEAGVAWNWPTNGKLLRGYSDSNKGIDIGGRMGQPVLAAGDGKVVYSGNGLRGYGKLIIIKHNKTYLSAYAHNSQLLVKEGQSVKRGQKIAEMGNSDADQVKLHFEIRRFGKPVDPLQYLNSKP